MSSFECFPRPTKTYHSTTYDRISKHHGFDGKGKTILITDGATGVGYIISKAFAEAGVACIAIISHSAGPQEKVKADLEAAHPSVLEVLPYQASITDGARVADIFRDLGTVDVVVLCAAVYHRRARATEITAGEVQEVFDTNVVGAFNMARAYLADTPLPAAGTKTIINVSSAAGQMRSPLRAGYGPSKAAVTQVMQHFAFEQEGDDVRVFSFHPGAFYTPSAAEIYTEDALVWEDINLPAHFALWLAGPESGFLNGRYVWAHWDIDELIALKERLAKDPAFLTIGLVL